MCGSGCSFYVKWVGYRIKLVLLSDNVPGVLLSTAGVG